MKSIKIKRGNVFVSKNAKLLESLWELASGLMFKRDGEVVLKLKSENKNMAAIHTFFCVPLIVAWLDKNLKVVDIKKAKPWNHYKPKKPAMYVFETTNMKKKIKIGEKWKIILKRN